MKKLIFINYLPLTKKVAEDFYMSKLIDRGFEVKYLDVTNIFFKNISISDTIERDYITKINSYKDLKVFFEDKKDAIYIILVTYELRVLKLHRFFKKYNLKTMFFARYGLPIYGNRNNNRNIFQKILALIKMPSKINGFFKGFFKNYFAKFVVLFGYVKLYDVVFAAGELVKNSFKKNVKIVIEINYYDYDKFLEIKDKTGNILIDKKYCVYLDEYAPFHPDFVVLGFPTLEPYNYYNSMNNFFDLVEKRFNIEVVIAAHPKADYTKNFFNGRKIFKYKTAELVKNSEFCFSHISASTCFSIFFNKPLFFIYTNEFKKLYEKNNFSFMVRISNVLGRQIFNINDIDDKFDFNKFDMNVDSKLYSDYIINYFTTKKTENIMTFDILINFLMGF